MSINWSSIRVALVATVLGFALGVAYVSVTVDTILYDAPKLEDVSPSLTKKYSGLPSLSDIEAQERKTEDEL